jgi:hypothetical protein
MVPKVYKTLIFIDLHLDLRKILGIFTGVSSDSVASLAQAV